MSCGECRACGWYMNVVCGIRGVGGMCEMCMCLDRGGMGRGMRGLGLCFTNPVGIGDVFWVAVGG